MRRRVELHHLALREVTEAERWYASHSEEAASRFRLAVKDSLQAIAERSAVHPLDAHKGIWYVRVSRFPYRLIFVEFEDSAKVIAVSHSRRRPEYWKRRR